MITYLCGIIDDSKDGGVRWRERLTPDLEKIGIEVFDPTSKESEQFGITIEAHKERLHKMKLAGKWEEFAEIMNAIIKQDLQAVDDADFIIALVPDKEGGQMGGTVHELTRAWRLGKPVLWKCSGTVSDMNNWILALLLKVGKRFDTWDAMIDYIKKEYPKK